MNYESMFKPEDVAVYDPIIDAQPKKYFAVLKGGVETTERTFTSSTFSNSSTQFSVPPPNPSTFVSRRFMLKQPVTITITGTTSDDVNIYQTGYSAFRQSPLASIMQTLDVVLNGQSVSLNMNDVIKPLLLYHNNERDLNERELSLSPLLRDQSQQYADLAGANSSNRNPLEGFATTGPRASQARGAFSYDTFDTSGGVNTNVIKATLCEELYLSPLLFGGVRDQGFIGLQKIELNFTWDNNLEKIWSHTPSPTELTYFIDVQLETPSILFRYVTPPLNFEMPPYMQYDYNEIQRYPTSFGVLASGSSFLSMASSNIQLNSVPRYIYLFARERNADFEMEATDSYMAIDKCQVNWNNNNALLSNASVQQLYDISRKNGVDLAWNEWSGIPSVNSLGTSPISISGIGSVLALEFGTDIGLREDEAPGIIGTYNLQVVLDVTNRSDHEQDITMYIITIIPGVFTIYQNSASKRIGILSKDDVLRAKSKPGLGYYDLQRGLKSGGFKKKSSGGLSFGKSLKKVGKYIKKKGIRKGTKFISTVAPTLAMIPGIGPYAAAIGMSADLVRKAYGKKGRAKRIAKREVKRAGELTKLRSKLMKQGLSAKEADLIIVNTGKKMAAQSKGATSMDVIAEIQRAQDRIAEGKYRAKYDARKTRKSRKRRGGDMITIEDAANLIKGSSLIGGRKRRRPIVRAVRRRVGRPRKRRGGAPLGGAPLGGAPLGGRRKVGRPKKRGGKYMSKAE